MSRVNRRIASTALALPLISWGAALFVALEPRQWLSLSTSVLRGFTADALLYTTGCAIVAAPLCGIAALSAARGTNPGPVRISLATAWLLGVPVLLFTAASALVTLIASGGDSAAVAFVAVSHATLAAVAFALAAFGALTATFFHDTLDAAACSLTIALVAAGGLLVAGASVADMPKGLVDFALLASPLVAVASSAHIDLVRMDVLYQISPLAHLGTEYPDWQVAVASYVAAGFVCLGAITVICATSEPMAPRRRSLQTPQVS